MSRDYQRTAKMLKAISDPKRLQIVDMLSNGELCACKILEAFQVTQPTLSHDMRLLIEAGLVRDRRDGKRVIYSLNMEEVNGLLDALHEAVQDKQECICHLKQPTK